MTDEKFERDLRATLDELAREPAPERLVSRVSEIPAREPAAWTTGVRRGGSGRAFGSLAGLVAAAVAIVVAALFVRPGAGPSVGASPTISSPSADPTLSPHGSPLPSAFAPVSATFISADEGWVLGGVPCDRALCPVIAHTTDGGESWSSVAPPNTPAHVGRPPGLGEPGSAGLSVIRFANRNDGWVFGPQLWATHDGGATWTRQRIPDVGGPTLLALEAAAGRVHVVLDDGQDFRIASSPAGADRWEAADVRIPYGAGPVPRLQLVLSGTSGWVLENDRVVTAGARLEAGTWREWRPPCLDVVGPAILAASTASDVVAVCDVGLLSTPEGEQLFVSNDGGTSFAPTESRPPVTSAGAVAMPDESAIVVAGSVENGSALVASYDGGRTWSTVQSGSSVFFGDLGFTTATQGIAITIDNSGASQLLMTRDAGRTWMRIMFST